MRDGIGHPFDPLWVDRLHRLAFVEEAASTQHDAFLAGQAFFSKSWYTIPN